MLKGFRDFIMRGNVIDLAVGVVIGSAFTAVVTAFSNYIINPLIAGIGGNEFGFGFNVIPGNESTFVNLGAVLTALINFLLIAAVVYFLIVLPKNKFDELQKRARGISEKEPAPTDTELLTEIRDLLAGQSPKDAGTPPPVER
ncbi:Large-conductance mechanosensitive channel [Corynebacterium capitovis DSM 44611]|uniref:large conductance mechanosensitive channel protein MscL n=1 Tax=Corynebacterium capitovis TaxID=131081 RepID=UPI00036F0DAF|nr:large conductance mechanosensitive channel protein MscL [Corynebacterium capitovis]WKD58036.1 Large-conductance mechanosensitive channel [Corynebacterium capitovis DSM 44611]